MTASEFQQTARLLLTEHYGDSQVKLEWPIYKDASDAMQRVGSQYYPRTDIAVGPFSTAPGRHIGITLNHVNDSLKLLLRKLPASNPNPRCLLAIEVVFSGSSKHILGDMLNASAIGLYGIVVGKPEMMPKIQRNREYLHKLAALDKLNPLPFQNVLVISTSDFERLFTA